MLNLQITYKYYNSLKKLMLVLVVGLFPLGIVLDVKRQICTPQNASEYCAEQRKYKTFFPSGRLITAYVLQRFVDYCIPSFQIVGITFARAFFPLKIRGFPGFCVPDPCIHGRLSTVRMTNAVFAGMALAPCFRYNGDIESEERRCPDIIQRKN